MSDEEEVKIVFAPGCFDDMDEEEAKELHEHIMKLFNDGELENNSTAVDLDILEEKDPELYNELMNFDPTRGLH